MDLLHDRFEASLGFVESLRQTVVAFLVFDLVEGNVGIFVNGSDGDTGNDLQTAKSALLTADSWGLKKIKRRARLW